MKRALIGVIGFAAIALASSGAQADWTAHRVAVVEGLQVPECVVVDVDTGAAYVSNVVADHADPSRAQYWAEDGTGFISRLKPGGAVDVLRWQESSAAFPLNAPKGMAIFRGQLVVNDVNRVIRFPLAADGPARQRPVEGAVRLNDMASDGRAIYASDTAEGVIYRLSRAGVEKLKAPPAVNGITFAQGKFFAVSRDLHEVYELDPAGLAEPKPFGLAAHFTALDGIEVLDDGTFIVSDFPGNKVCTISPDRRTVQTLLELATPADIGLDRARMLLYVPLFTKDRVEVYRLEKR